MSLRPPQTESERKKNENQRGHLKAKLKYTLRFVKTGAHETNINKNMLFFFIVEHPKNISQGREQKRRVYALINVIAY